MRFDDEIARAVRHQAANDTKTTKTNEEKENIINAVKTAITNSQYDFSKSESIVLNQNGNKRFVKQFADYSIESILCQCIKQILDRVFKIKYLNRNKSVRSLFGILTAVKQMVDFTIVKFDFKDYFNSISSVYVFEKFLKVKLTNRFEIDLIHNFAKNTKYAYAGFSTSNAVAEIITEHFDEVLKKALIDKGVIFSERYIDDGLIIFNEHVEESECGIILQQALDSVFRDKAITAQPKCKTRFNNNKFKYISKRNISNNLVSFEYLGYEFWLGIQNKKTVIKYGITQSKRDKYNKRVDEFILCYIDNNHDDFGNLELLRHRIAAFTSRTVYRGKRYKSDVWKVKGFISNYGELRYLLDTVYIENDTETLGKSGYNLFENMRKNKSLVLVKHIGYDYNALVKLCKQIGINDIDKNGIRRGYGNLVREYLIKTKIGY